MKKTHIDAVLSRMPFTYLKEFVYGGIDGSVTTFAVVAGATGANMNAAVIIVLGFANLIADGFSMSVGNYLSVKSEIAMERGWPDKERKIKSPYKTATATFVSFIIMGFIPLLVYVLSYLGFVRADSLFLISCILTGFCFILIGFLRSYVDHKRYVRGILETLLLGGTASALAYIVGNVLENAL